LPDYGEDRIISSRLLIMQSKRLRLMSLRRRLAETGVAALQSRVDSLHAEAMQAQHQYRAAIMHWGSPEHADYWVVAYSRLIEIGNALTDKMRDAAATLPPHERYELAADIEMLEEIVRRWSESRRESMAATVA
jgi:hypothetical protein